MCCHHGVSNYHDQIACDSRQTVWVDRIHSAYLAAVTEGSEFSLASNLHCDATNDCSFCKQLLGIVQGQSLCVGDNNQGHNVVVTVPGRPSEFEIYMSNFGCYKCACQLAVVLCG